MQRWMKQQLPQSEGETSESPPGGWLQVINSASSMSADGQGQTKILAVSVI